METSPPLEGTYNSIIIDVPKEWLKGKLLRPWKGRRGRGRTKSRA